MDPATLWAVTCDRSDPHPAEEARVPALDAGYLAGESVYETLRTYHARPFALEDHLARLSSGLARLAAPSVDAEALASALRALARLRAPAESHLRVCASAGLRPWGQGPAGGACRWTALAGPLPPHLCAAYERGVGCILASRPRWNPSGYVPAVKFNGNPELALARDEAAAAGAYEALLLSPGGDLAEGASTNVFLAFGRTVVTPHLATGILDGVTRGRVLALCPRAGLAAEERRVDPRELFAADEVFLTSTTREVVPVVSVDGRPVGRGEPGLLADRLLGLYQEAALEATSGDRP